MKKYYWQCPICGEWYPMGYQKCNNKWAKIDGEMIPDNFDRKEHDVKVKVVEK